MALQQNSPMVKFETSPAESFLSVPGDNFSSLFASSETSTSSTTATTATTMDPMEMMTPRSYSDDRQDSSRLSAVPEQGEENATATSDSCPSSEKKPVKKRKSWGQVLPEPKTNLPPRKRAKTDDEKEQRRVERVLRNRRAAQSSRERKRLEVEALEERNKQLEEMLISAQKTNLMLVEELNRFRRGSGVVARSSSPLDSLRDNVTLSQQLFGSQDGTKSSPDQSLVDELIRSTSNPTVNPASLSPEPTTPDADLTVDDTEMTSATTTAAPATPEASKTGDKAKATPSTSDSTQRPAEMLCDLQCQSEEEQQTALATSLVSRTQTPPLLAWCLQLRMMLLSASVMLSACQRPLMQIAMSSKAGFSLLPTPQLLTTIIWLVTLPPASRINPTSTSSTSTTSSATKQTTSPLTLWQRATMPLRTTVSTSRSTTLRLKSLRNILSSSPSLARPLMDATMVALRLVSEGRDDQRDGSSKRETSATRGEADELTQCLRNVSLPSKEVLMTLLWALRVEERRIQRRSIVTSVSHPDSVDGGVPGQPAEQHQYVLFSKVAGAKRARQQQQQRTSSSKRARYSM